MFARVFRHYKPRTPAPEVRVEFRRYANANSTIRWERDQMLVRISDLLEGAPAPVLEALAHILLAKLFRREVPRAYSHRYRLYLNRRDVRRSIHLVRQIRGRKVYSGAKGEVFDLDEMFEVLNRRHFDGLLARPTLSWSPRASRSVLGHFDPSHNAIILSRVLDRADVPRSAVEYVLFHEMLHLRYPVQHQGAARRVHTAEFRAAERAYPGYKEAKRHLLGLR